MNSIETANNFINRVKNLQTFEVKRMLDEPLIFRGKVPFDVKANQECAWFKVVALTQKEAEELVDRWILGEDI